MTCSSFSSVSRLKPAVVESNGKRFQRCSYTLTSLERQKLNGRMLGVSHSTEVLGMNAHPIETRINRISHIGRLGAGPPTSELGSAAPISLPLSGLYAARPCAGAVPDWAPAQALAKGQPTSFLHDELYESWQGVSW